MDDKQKLRLAQVLIEFQDVFAANEFDLGNFKDIEHTIDTGDAKPVRQRIRRTPVCFADEEEAHLNKMLKAGVIQESIRRLGFRTGSYSEKRRHSQMVH